MSPKTASRRQTTMRGPRPPRRPPGKKPPARPGGKLPRPPGAPKPPKPTKPIKKGAPPPRKPARTRTKLSIPWFKLFLPFLLVGLIAAGFGGYIYYRGSQSLPEIDGSISLPGLTASVDVLRDRYGVPHLFASSLEDLARANGYVHAQDRYFQMEISRRLGAGTMAEIFGAELLPLDKRARRFAFGQAARGELERLDPSAHRLLQAYADGINAYRESYLERLPPEFQMLELEPEPWTPADTLAIGKWMSHLLSFNGSVEVLRAHLSEALGVESAYLMTGLVPPEPDGTAHFMSPVPYVNHRGDRAASNAWAVSGFRTASGMPLLASDPHLPLPMPSLWYEIHLEGGGLNVVGASLPGIPLVLIGHNDRIAWGVTASFADVQDHYIETLNPEDPNQYAAGDQWEAFHVSTETIPVADSNPLPVEFKWSRHGVVVSDKPRDGKVLALRWDGPWSGDNVSAMLQLNMATGWLDFTEALGALSSFPFAFVYADVEGNIGFFPSGDIPLRDGFDGSLPVDGGSGAFEWQGYVPHEAKPYFFNPEEGYIICANHNMAPDDPSSVLGRDQLAPFRAQRIASLLTSARALRPADFAFIQTDRYDNSTETILQQLVSLPLGSEDDAAVAQDLLRAWNGQMTSGSAPAIYQAFYAKLIENTFKDELGDELFSEFLEFLELGYPGGVYAIVDDPSSEWWDDRRTPNVEDRNAIFNRSLREALQLLENRSGNNPEGWDWAMLHGVAFEHPLGQKPPLNWIFNRGPIPFGGSTFTVANAVVSLTRPFDVPAGTSFRLVVDMSDLNASISSIPTGASGHPLSSHYFDQNRGWLDGSSHPLLFERSRIEDDLEGKLTLIP